MILFIEYVTIIKGVFNTLFINVGDWSSGMIGVSKTFGGGSIPSSPARMKPVNFEKSRFAGLFCAPCGARR